jgi:hypothetical protein
MVTSISTPRLSVFQDPGPFYSNPHNCTYALLRYPKKNNSIKRTDYFMCADDIPAVISYLKVNGYTVENGFYYNGGVSETKLSGNRKVICSFSRR